MSVCRGCLAPSGSCISFRPPRFTTIGTLDQQRHDTRLLGEEEIVPQRAKLLQGCAGVDLGDVVVVGAGRLTRPRDDQMISGWRNTAGIGR